MPAAPAIDVPELVAFDPEVIFAELHAVGLHLYLSRPIAFDAPPSHYVVVPRRGLPFTAAQLDVMSRWATALTAEPHRCARLEEWLAAFERGETGQG